jgi:hypothetical protein
MSNADFELQDPTLDEYDPARRRLQWAYDPSRRRKRGGRKGRMPAGLRRYWASKRRGKMADPARRRHYGRRRHDPAPRRGGFRFGRRRRHDPGFGTAGSWTRSATDYGGVAVGSMLHNFIVHTKGFLSGVFNAGPINITQLGAVAGLVGIVGEHQRMIEPGGILSDILKGMFAEGLNVPGVESIARAGPGGGGMVRDGSGGGLAAGGSFPSGATQSPLGVGPTGSYIPVWAYT